MKLDKKQINALAQSFYKEIQDKIEKANKDSREKQLEKFRPYYDKGIQILKNNKFIESIFINIGNGYSVELKSTNSFDEFTDDYSFDYVIKKRNNAIVSDIENDIILATIDAKSVDDITKILKNKYK